jgi:predicted ATPase
MFTRIQTNRYRSLRSVDQALGPVHALVGPNASGKTTFLDVIGFVSSLMRDRGEVRATVEARSENFRSLLWGGRGSDFQLALEAPIPPDIRAQLGEGKKQFDTVRYELAVGVEADVVGINHESLWLIDASVRAFEPPQRTLFPAPVVTKDIFLTKNSLGAKKVINKTLRGNDNFYTEGRKSYQPSFKLGRDNSALANTPADAATFPVSTWFRDLLERGIQSFVLNSQTIKRPSPPGQKKQFQPDGSNLPWVVADLRKNKKRFSGWLQHIRTALPDVVDVATIERPEDKHRYLTVTYSNGAVVPSWLVSDGTLRLLALTIPAYLSGSPLGVLMIEEPENGIHPRAIETVLQSLTSLYGSQVLMATHSPVALSVFQPDQLLCFAKDEAGATDIVSGSRHPKLKAWQKERPDLGILFASGVLS